MRAVAVIALAAGALVAGVTAATGGSASTTSLKITYWENGAGTNPVQVWTLRCGPASGTLRQPAVACRKLADGGRKLLAPASGGVLCTQIYGGPQVARVSGTFKGDRVWVTFNRADGCQIARWNKLAPWLFPRGGVA
jgi:Subtilisin inhibitor-like